MYTKTARIKKNHHASQVTNSRGLPMMCKFWNKSSHKFCFIPINYVQVHCYYVCSMQIAFQTPKTCKKFNQTTLINNKFNKTI